MAKFFALIFPAIIAIIFILLEHKSRLGWLLISLTILATVFAVCDRISNDAESDDEKATLKVDLNKMNKKYDSISVVLNKNLMGEGYSIFNLVSTERKNEYAGALLNQNNFPAYDIHLTIIPAYMLRNCVTEMANGSNHLDRLCIDGNSFSVRIDELYPKRFQYPIGNYKIITKEKLVYLEVNYTSRSADIIQQTVIKLGKGVCEQAYRIFDVTPRGRNATISFELLETHNGITGLTINWDDFVPVDNRIMMTY